MQSRWTDTLHARMKALLGQTWPIPGLRERVRQSLGLGLGLWAAAVTARFFLGDEAAWLALPVGASAVLVFAVPASPMAQPWPVMAGQVVSAAVGVCVYQLAGAGPFAAAMAGALALLAMASIGALHPPGGAMAVSAVLGGPKVLALGWLYPVLPVALNLLILLLVAWGCERLTAGRKPG